MAPASGLGVPKCVVPRLASMPGRRPLQDLSSPRLSLTPASARSPRHSERTATVRACWAPTPPMRGPESGVGRSASAGSIQSSSSCRFESLMLKAQAGQDQLTRELAAIQGLSAALREQVFRSEDRACRSACLSARSQSTAPGGSDTARSQAHRSPRSCSASGICSPRLQASACDLSSQADDSSCGGSRTSRQRRRSTGNPGVFTSSQEALEALAAEAKRCQMALDHTTFLLEGLRGKVRSGCNMKDLCFGNSSKRLGHSGSRAGAVALVSSTARATPTKPGRATPTKSRPNTTGGNMHALLESPSTNWARLGMLESPSTNWANLLQKRTEENQAICRAACGLSARAMRCTSAGCGGA